MERYDKVAVFGGVYNNYLALEGLLEECAKIGVDAIWISNHGGRVLETDITALEQLNPIRKKVGKNLKIIVDGGIRTGSDVIKCLSLGADYVAIGRPLIYGLVADSKKGVQRVLELYLNELKTTMHLCGVGDIRKISKNNTIVKFK